MLSPARKEIWFRCIFHWIGILGESPFVSNCERQKAPHTASSVEGTGGYVPRFLSVVLALSFFRFDGESRPAHQQVTRAVGRLKNKSNSNLSVFAYATTDRLESYRRTVRVEII